ncbi:MAG: ankyrin repeat domain-containing protein [Parachlamydiaceae bacterium]
MSFLSITPNVKFHNKFNRKEIDHPPEIQAFDWHQVKTFAPRTAFFELLLALDLISEEGQLTEKVGGASWIWPNLSQPSLQLIEAYWQGEERLYSAQLKAEVPFIRREFIEFLINKRMIDPASFKMVGSGVLQVCGYRYFLEQLVELIKNLSLGSDASIDQLEKHLGRDAIHIFKESLEQANDYDFRVPLANLEGSFQDLELAVREFFIQKLDPQVVKKGAQLLRGKFPKRTFTVDDDQTKELILLKFFFKPIDIFIGGGDRQDVDNMQLYRLGEMDLTVYKSLRRESRFTKRSVELPMEAFFSSAPMETIPDTAVKNQRQVLVDIIAGIIRPSRVDEIDPTDWLHALIHFTKGSFLSEPLEDLFFKKFTTGQKPIEKQIPYCLQHLPSLDAKLAFFWNLFASMYVRRLEKNNALKLFFEKQVATHPSLICTLLHSYVKDEISFPLCQVLLQLCLSFNSSCSFEKGFLRFNSFSLKRMEDVSPDFLIEKLGEIDRENIQKKLLVLFSEMLVLDESVSIEQRSRLLQLASLCLQRDQSYLHQVAFIWFSKAHTMIHPLGEQKKWLKVIFNLAGSKLLDLNQIQPCVEESLGIKTGSLKKILTKSPQNLVQSLASSRQFLLKELSFDFWKELARGQEASSIASLTLGLIDHLKKDFEKNCCELITYLHQSKVINAEKAWQLLKDLSFKESLLHQGPLIDLIRQLCEHQKDRFLHGEELIKILLQVNSTELTVQALKQPLVRNALIRHPEFQKLMSCVDPLSAYKIWELIKQQADQSSVKRSAVISLSLHLLGCFEEDLAISHRILSSVAPLLTEKEKEKFSRFAKKIYAQYEHEPNWLLLTKKDALELKEHLFFQAIEDKNREVANRLFLQLADEKACYQVKSFKEKAQGWVNDLLKSPSRNDWLVLVRASQGSLFAQHFPEEYALILFSRFHEKLHEHQGLTDTRTVQRELFEMLLLIKRHALIQHDTPNAQFSAFARDYLFFLTHYWLPEADQHHQHRQLFAPYLSQLLNNLLDDIPTAIQLFVKLHTCQFLTKPIKIDPQILKSLFDFIIEHPISSSSLNVLLLYATEEQKAKLVEWRFSIRDEKQLYQLLLQSNLNALESFIHGEKLQLILHWTASTFFRQDIKAFALLCLKIPPGQLPDEADQFFHSINGLFEYSKEEIDLLCHLLKSKRVMTSGVCECLSDHISFLKERVDFIFDRLLGSFSELPVIQVQKLLLLLIQQATAPCRLIEKVLQHKQLLGFLKKNGQKSHFYHALLRLVIKDRVSLTPGEVLALIRRLYGNLTLDDRYQLALECLKKLENIADMEVLKGCWFLCLDVYSEIKGLPDLRRSFEKLVCRLIKKLKKTKFLRSNLERLLHQVHSLEVSSPQLLLECLFAIEKGDCGDSHAKQIYLFCKLIGLKNQWDAETIRVLQKNQEELRQRLLPLIQLKSSFVNRLFLHLLTDEQGNIYRYFNTEKTLPLLIRILKEGILSDDVENSLICDLRSSLVFMRYLSRFGSDFILFNQYVREFFNKQLPLLRKSNEPLELEACLKEIHKVWLTKLKQDSKYLGLIQENSSHINELFKEELIHFIKVEDHSKIKIVFQLLKKNLRFHFSVSPLLGQLQSLISLLIFDIGYGHLMKQENGSLIEPSFFSRYAYDLYNVQAFAIEHLSKMSTHPFALNGGWYALPKSSKKEVIEIVIRSLSKREFEYFKCVCDYLIVFQEIDPDPGYLQKQYNGLFKRMRDEPSLVANGFWAGIYQYYKENNALLSLPFLHEYLEVAYHYFRHLREENDKMFFYPFAIGPNKQEAKERLEKCHLVIYQVFCILHEEHPKWGENYGSLFHHIKRLLECISMAQMLENFLNMTNHPCTCIEINALRLYELLLKIKIDTGHSFFLEYRELLKTCFIKAQLVFFPTSLDVSKIYDSILNPFNFEYVVSCESRATLTRTLQAIKEDRLKEFQQLNFPFSYFNFTQLACLAGAKEILAFLCSNYPEQMKLDMNMTALAIAVAKGDEALTQFLLQKSQNLIDDEALAHSLGLAILVLPPDKAEKMFDLFQLNLPLLRLNAICKIIIPSYQLTIIHIAAKKRHLAIFKKLFDAGLPLGREDDQGNNPLHFILLNENASESDQALVSLAVRAKADPLTKNHQGAVPLFLACQKQDRSLLATLIDIEGLFPAFLLFCINAGNEIAFKQISQLFEERYPQRKIKDVYDQLLQGEKNLLHFASLIGEYSIVKEILASGGDPSIRSQVQTPSGAIMDRTALEYALGHQFSDVAELILEKEIELVVGMGKEVEIRPSKSPLHWAATGRPSKNIIKKLLRWGLSLLNVDEQGDTPLHIAICNKNVTLAQQLINYAKKKHLLEQLIDSPNRAGNTLLHLAAQQGLTEIVLILLQSQARLLKNKGGKTAADIARSEGYDTLASIIDRSVEQRKQRKGH